MKNSAFFSNLLLVSILYLLIQCKKDDFTSVKNEDNNENVSESIPNQRPPVVYASFTCTIDNGYGCECIITSNDDDCEVQTGCVSGSRLINYDETLNAMFSAEQIAERVSKKVRITEPELKAALKLDGFPIK